MTANLLPEFRKTVRTYSGPDRYKVMYIINDLSVGGAEMMLYKLLAKSNRERFDPVVISLMDQGALRERIEELGIEVYTTGMKPGRPSLSGLWRLVRLLRRLKPDLIFGWMYHSCLAAHLSKFLSIQRAPVLWSVHYSVGTLDTDKRTTAWAIRVCARLSKLSDKIVFVSQVSQKKHVTLGYNINNSCVIPNGIDVSHFIPSAEARRSVRGELGLDNNEFLIGLIGRSHPMKDHPNFLKAAALISKLYPKTHFVMIGRGIDTDNQMLNRMIQEFGLVEKVHLLGDRHDVPRLAAALDIFTLSSSYGESFPNVIGEAMACGVPCVVTDVGDAAWIVGETGQVVPPCDSEAMASGWKEMIELGAEGRAALGQAARVRVTDFFLLQSVVDKYEALFETVLNPATL
jgi:glycosyltransferase involved in cell wall biosynthesis